MNEDGKLFNQWFGKTVIHSDRRFAYEDAQEIIEGKSGDFDKEIIKKKAKQAKMQEKEKEKIEKEKEKRKLELVYKKVLEKLQKEKMRLLMIYIKK